MLMWVGEDNFTIFLHHIQEKDKQKSLKEAILQMQDEMHPENYTEECKKKEYEGCTIDQVRFNHKTAYTKFVTEV